MSDGMTDAEIEALGAEADQAWEKDDFVTTFRLSERLAQEDVRIAILRCALILERGFLNGGYGHPWIAENCDLDGALAYYHKLTIGWNSDTGYLGCVRVMLLKRSFADRDRAITYCVDVTRGPLSGQAHLLLGQVYDELFDPPEHGLARKRYLMAACHGAAWGMRYYAESLMRTHNVLGGILMHVVATLVSPIVCVTYGRAATIEGVLPLAKREKARRNWETKTVLGSKSEMPRGAGSNRNGSEGDDHEAGGSN